MLVWTILDTTFPKKCFGLLIGNKVCVADCPLSYTTERTLNFANINHIQGVKSKGNFWASMLLHLLTAHLWSQQFVHTNFWFISSSASFFFFFSIVLVFFSVCLSFLPCILDYKCPNIIGLGLANSCLLSLYSLSL